MKTTKSYLTILLLTSIVLACSDSSEEEITPNANNGSAELKAAEDYFNNTLKSVITTDCISCHSNYHSSGSSNYSIFTNARSNAGSMYNLVNAGTMPKGGAKLSNDDIDKFKTFRDLVAEIP